MPRSRAPRPHLPRKEIREMVADWMMVLGALVLFISLFLAWSHQFSASFMAAFGTSVLLQGVPHDPTAWQVYSVADVLLALVAVGVFVIALIGTRRVRIGGLFACSIALGFTLHALSVPPTNGANIFNPALSVPTYMSNGATAAVGETVAIVGLTFALAGLALSFTAD